MKINLNKPQIESVLLLSSGGNAALWNNVELAIEQMIQRASEDLEKSSDTTFLFRKQGELAALRSLRGLRDTAQSLMETNTA